MQCTLVAGFERNNFMGVLSHDLQGITRIEICEWAGPLVIIEDPKLNVLNRMIAKGRQFGRNACIANSASHTLYVLCDNPHQTGRLEIFVPQGKHSMVAWP